jgi:hypothetical protein
MTEWTTKKVLITVRTYPAPSGKSVEVSCTAGITEDGDWIRLFPVPYRFVKPDKRFKKYQWVSVKVRKAKSDPRPESHNLDIDSIRILKAVPPAKGWIKRRVAIGEKNFAHCMCCLKRHHDQPGAPTIGIFKPREIERLVLQPASPNWTARELRSLRQVTFFENAPVNELEKIPFKFKYKYRCDDAACRGHSMSCSDWEMGESFRRWKSEHPTDWESKFREKYERQMIEENDTHFYVGTVHKHPKNWIIVGLWYPRAEAAWNSSLQPQLL